MHTRPPSDSSGDFLRSHRPSISPTTLPLAPPPTVTGGGVRGGDKHALRPLRLPAARIAFNWDLTVWAGVPGDAAAAMLGDNGCHHVHVGVCTLMGLNIYVEPVDFRWRRRLPSARDTSKALCPRPPALNAKRTECLIKNKPSTPSHVHAGVFPLSPARRLPSPGISLRRWRSSYVHIPPSTTNLAVRRKSQ